MNAVLPDTPAVAPSHVYDRIKAMATTFRLRPGERVNELELARQLGVSRTPVREALLRLAEAGLVEIFPQSGTFVARIPVAAIPEAVVIRKSLEGTTVEKATAIARPEDIARLDAVIARQRVHAGLSETSLFHEQDEAFHEAIAAIAGYPGIWALLKTVKLQIDRARRLTLPALGRMDSVIEEHVTIRNAIAAHDQDAAHAAMMHHLSAVIPDIDELRLLYPGFFR